MYRFFKLVAPFATLLSVGVLPAVAQTAPALPVIAIQEVDAADSATYAMWVARNNELVKAKLGIDKFVRVYIGVAAADESGVVLAVRRADSFATLTKNWQAVLADPAFAENRASMDAIRELGSQTLLKALRFDGTNPDAWLLNTQVMVSDEAGYMKALEGLRALYDRNGLNDAKINAYRVVAGRGKYSHLVSINTPSAERLAAVLDTISTAPWMAQWLADTAKYRTVVRNGTYREITR
jgi:hypothetical protein